MDWERERTEEITNAIAMSRGILMMLMPSPYKCALEILCVKHAISCGPHQKRVEHPDSSIARSNMRQNLQSRDAMSIA